MRAIRSLFVTTIAAALIAATAGSAHAAGTTVIDKRADVVRYEFDSNGQVDFSDPKYLNQADSIATGVDITSARVEHRKSTYFVRLQFAQLTNLQTDSYGVIQMRGSKYSAVYYEARGTIVRVWDDKTGRRLCTGSSKRIPGDRGVIYASISRKCLGYPSQIRAGVGTFLEDGDYLYDESVSPSKKQTTTYSKWLRSS